MQYFLGNVDPSIKQFGRQKASRATIGARYTRMLRCTRHYDRHVSKDNKHVRTQCAQAYTVYGIRRTKTHITMKRRMRMEYGYKHAVSAQEEGVNQTSHAMSNTRIDSPR